MIKSQLLSSSIRSKTQKSEIVKGKYAILAQKSETSVNAIVRDRLNYKNLLIE